MRDVRTKKKITRKQLAADVGCTYSMIQQIESGGKKPSLDLAKRIAKRLGKSVDSLFLDQNKDAKRGT